MKTIKLIGFLMLGLLLNSCESMDDNYQQYVVNVKVYSPKVSNLSVISGLKEATLNWKNPQGNIAVKNAVKLQDSIIVIDGLVETYKLTNLEIRGYQISVYTIDKFNNYSVPVSTSIFPNGE